jgi:hypothetical protein
MSGGADEAPSGHIVFIATGTTITLLATDNAVTIPAGVTIASDRGYSTNTGGMIKKTLGPGGYVGRALCIGGANVRITGLILEGEMIAEGAEHDDTDGYGEAYLLTGIYNGGGYMVAGYGGLVVDNCEIRGWGYAGVFSQMVPTATRPWIHHNYIHHMGYGVNINGGDGLVEANIFDYNRHDMTGGGLTGEKYEFRYNIILGHGMQTGASHVDVHENEYHATDGLDIAGSTFLIHHNTVNQGSGTAQAAFVHVRDNPQVGAYVENNLINTDWGTGSNDDGAQSVIYQTHNLSATWARLFCTNNTWKGVIYPDNTTIVWYQG